MVIAVGDKVHVFLAGNGVVKSVIRAPKRYKVKLDSGYVLTVYPSEIADSTNVYPFPSRMSGDAPCA